MIKTRVFEIPGNEDRRIKFSIASNAIKIMYQEKEHFPHNDTTLWTDKEGIGEINYKSALWSNTGEIENE